MADLGRQLPSEVANALGGAVRSKPTQGEWCRDAPETLEPYKLPPREAWPRASDRSPAAERFRACERAETVGRDLERWAMRLGGRAEDLPRRRAGRLLRASSWVWDAAESLGAGHPYGAPLLRCEESLRALYGSADRSPERVLALFAEEVFGSRSRSRSVEGRDLRAALGLPARGVLERFLRLTQPTGLIPSVCLYR